MPRMTKEQKLIEEKKQFDEIIQNWPDLIHRILMASGQYHTNIQESDREKDHMYDLQIVFDAHKECFVIEYDVWGINFTLPVDPMTIPKNIGTAQTFVNEVELFENAVKYIIDEKNAHIERVKKAKRVKEKVEAVLRENLDTDELNMVSFYIKGV